MLKRLLLRLSIALAVLAIAAGIAALAGLWWLGRYMESDRLARLIESSTSRALQRRLEIGGLERGSFPHLTLTAQDVRLLEPDGDVIASSPEVRARLSLTSLFTFRLGIDRLEFVSPTVRLRLHGPIDNTVTRMMADMRMRPKSGRPSVVGLLFNEFTIEHGSLQLFDGKRPSPFLEKLAVDAEGELDMGMGGTKFPFSLSAGGHIAGEALGAEAKGTLSSDPQVSFRVHNWPVAALSVIAPFLSTCTGRVSLDGSFRRSGDRQDWAVNIASGAACGAAVALPALKISGESRKASAEFRAVATSSRTSVVYRAVIPADSALPVAATVDSPRAALEEVILWSRLGNVFRSQLATDRARTTAKSASRQVNLEISVSSITFRDRELGFVGLTMSRRTDRIESDDVDARVFGGTIQGGLSISSKTVMLDLRGRGLRAERLAALLAKPPEISGNTDVELTVRCDSGARWLPTLQGTATVKITDGNLAKSPAILKSFSEANLTTLLDKMKGDAPDPGFPIKEGRAVVRLDKGVAYADEPWFLRNRVAQIGWIGAIDFGNRTMDGHIIVHVLTVADEVIREIPIIGKLLQGDDKSFIPLWIKVEGSMDDPNVRTEAARSISRPLWDTVGRVLKLPERLLKSLTGRDK